VTPAQAREVLVRRLAALTGEDPPLAVRLRAGDPPHHEVEEEVAAVVPTNPPPEIDDLDDADEIRAALERLDLGTWGACGSCGSPIDAERLTRSPYSRFCADCA
jgi:hypothetical protein